jgi:hypothetical protein
LLAAKDRTHAAEFVEKIKAFVTSVSPTSKVAFTGSGIITILNQIRMLRRNSYDIWSSARLLSLGTTPSAAAAEAIAMRMLTAAATQYNWPPELVTYLRQGNPSRLVAILTDSTGDGATAPRPALIAQLLGNIRQRPRKSPEELVNSALTRVCGGLQSESFQD